MANYYATARSNYFRVKDAKKFEGWCKKRELVFWKRNERGVGKRYAISPGGSSETGWPSYDCEEDAEIDIIPELAGHLDPRDIAVLVQIGWEKLRYLTGEAIAVHASGRTVRVDLDDIYDRAIETFDGDLTVTEAAY